MITLTEGAVKQVRTILDREKKAEHGLRVSVVGGGCSGFSYKMGLEETAGPEDQIYEFDGVEVFVDKKSAPLLNGIVLDYKDDLLDSGFKFSNPNAKNTCGCGSSFGV